MDFKVKLAMLLVSVGFFSSVTLANRYISTLSDKQVKELTTIMIVQEGENEPVDVKPSVTKS